MAIKLSICIPTYNRSEYLRECLNTVAASISGYEHEIEVIISDNASTYETDNVVQTFQQSFPWIRYHRNEQNIGAERNFYLLATLAQGDYIWIFGDDDKMADDAIPSVIRNIDLGYSLIICNCSIWDKSFNTMITLDGLHAGKDRVIDGHNELMKSFGLYLGYISSVIIKKANFLLLAYEDYAAFAEYGFSFMYSVYTGEANKCSRAVYISAPIVHNRSGNSGDYDWYKYVVTGSSLIFDALKEKGYSSKAVLYAKHQVIRYFVIPKLLSAKLHDSNDHGNVRKLLFTYYKGNWSFWLVCLPISYIPAILIRFAKHSVIKLRQLRYLASRT